MPEDVVLAHPWRDLHGPGDAERLQVQAVTQELLRELSPGHALYGVAFTVVGRSDARDDVLLRFGGRWALVHLTWSGKSEVAPWPTCTTFDSASDAGRATALG
ncbi:hypothetical protein I0C86_03100 [Plantactinospora sp. S1510]|uniref:SnoaL-like domain-containing protein n=1 Tax=Plantactinospora alkalitolerans TaxID=2789879 RepID=A0ABS0GPT9_9ACTN|nr:hypothetical protein [Plantactinospora alkalitolerans]MBF9127988.1 hypothetical protein [Plantactinospora alkalitolerans]